MYMKILYMCIWTDICVYTNIIYICIIKDPSCTRLFGPLWQRFRRVTLDVIEFNAWAAALATLCRHREKQHV